VSEPADRPTVFVVEDDAAVRRSLTALLGLLDLPVECYASATEFLEAYEPTRRGCLVLDVRLGSGSGIDLHSRIVGAGSCLPTIFITGHALPMISEDTRGVVAVLQKPFRPQRLLEAIRQAVDLPA
jgi:FixJ family two-component response regulator